MSERESRKRAQRSARRARAARHMQKEKVYTTSPPHEFFSDMRVLREKDA